MPSVTRIVKFIKKGSDGDPAATVELTRTSILYSANNSGYSTAEQSFEVGVALKVKGSNCTIPSVASISVSTISGVSVTKNSTSKITLTVTHSQKISGVVIVQITGTYNGKTFTAKAGITVEPNREGAQGPQGEQGEQGPQGGTGGTGPRGYRGPGLRGPQDWKQMPVDYLFYKGDDSTQEPFVDFVIYNGTYYMCTKSHTKTSSNYPGSTYDNNNHLWQQSPQLGIVAANILFGKHGYFGSAIISGDWLISKNGTIDGVAYNDGATYNGQIAYSLFNQNNPAGNEIIVLNSTSTYNKAASVSQQTITTVSLTAGKTYYLSVTGKAGSSSGAYYIRLRNSSTGVTQTPVMINSTSEVTRGDAFLCSASGSYVIEFYDTSSTSATVTKVKLNEQNFAPRYALDLLTGRTYQHDGLFTGFVRKTKTKITTSNINQYKRTDITSANVLDFDKCGSFIEISSGVPETVLSLPLLNKELAERYTEEQKDQIRSYIGTELLIYNRSNADVNFVTKITPADGEHGSSTTSTQIPNNHFAALTCVVASDTVKELIYWKVTEIATIV